MAGADDDDEVALDEGMEPESLTGEDPGDDDDSYDDGDDDSAAGEVIEARARGGQASLVNTPRTVRRISDKTRELMREAAAKIKAAGGLDDEMEPLEHEDLEQEEAPPDPAASAELDAQGNPIAKPPEGKPLLEPPPPPSPDHPEVVKLREEYTGKLKELETREQQLSARELESDLMALGDQYIEAGAPAVVAVLKKWLGGNPSDEDMQTEVADLIADLSRHVLGAEIPEQVENRIERRRVKRLVAHNKAAQERTSKAAAEKARIANEEADRVRVSSVLTQEITKPENSKAYPFLAAEPEAGAIVYELAQRALAKDGTQLTWNEAAKRANDYLEKQSRAWFDTRRHLLITSTAAPSGNGQQQRNQGGQQVRSQALQQTPPPKAPKTPPAPPPDKPWNAEDHRRQIKAKFRKAFVPGDAE